MNFLAFFRERSMAKKSLKDGSRTLYEKQENSPDVIFCPFDQAHDWKAQNRFTITRKLKIFNNFQLIFGAGCPTKQFGSIIDLNCQEPLL